MSVTNTSLHLGLIALLQGAAERNPRFGRGIALGGEHVQWWGAHTVVGSVYSGGKCVQWWGARRRTAVYVPFSAYTMARSGEHRAFIVEEFIRNGGSPVATQRAFRIRFALGRRETVDPPAIFFSGATSKQRFTNNIP